jgi:hypothetical protein
MGFLGRGAWVAAGESSREGVGDRGSGSRMFKVSCVLFCGATSAPVVGAVVDLLLLVLWSALMVRPGQKAGQLWPNLVSRYRSTEFETPGCRSLVVDNRGRFAQERAKTLLAGGGEVGTEGWARAILGRSTGAAVAAKGGWKDGSEGSW